MKNIIFSSSSTPSVPGYPDKVAVTSVNDSEVIYHCKASCCPNPTEPRTSKPWTTAYGWVYPDIYKGECVEHDTYGKCILVAGGGEIGSRNYNPKHNGRCVIDQVFVHKGQTEGWRGSAGCLTVPPSNWTAFIALFDIGEKVTVSIIDTSGMGTN